MFLVPKIANADENLAISFSCETENWVIYIEIESLTCDGPTLKILMALIQMLPENINFNCITLIF